MTLNQIRSQVRADAGILNDWQFPNARLNKIINDAQRFVQNEAKWSKSWEEKNDFLTQDIPGEKDILGTTVNYVSLSVACPNYYEMDNPVIDIYFTDTNGSGNCEYVDERDFAQMLRNPYMQPNVYRKFFTIADEEIWIYPLMSQLTVADAYYYKKITDLSDDSDTTEIPDEYIPMFIKKCVAEVEDIIGKLANKRDALQQVRNEIMAVYQTEQIRDGEK